MTTISITNHAVDRYAERVLGLDPATLSFDNRALIRTAIRKAVLDVGTATANWTVRRTDAVYIVEDRAVKTVLLPRQFAEMKHARKGSSWRSEKRSRRVERAAP